MYSKMCHLDLRVYVCVSWWAEHFAFFVLQHNELFFLFFLIPGLGSDHRLLGRILFPNFFFFNAFAFFSSCGEAQIKPKKWGTLVLGRGVSYALGEWASIRRYSMTRDRGPWVFCCETLGGCSQWYSPDSLLPLTYLAKQWMFCKLWRKRPVPEAIQVTCLSETVGLRS